MIWAVIILAAAAGAATLVMIHYAIRGDSLEIDLGIQAADTALAKDEARMWEARARAAGWVDPDTLPVAVTDAQDADEMPPWGSPEEACRHVVKDVLYDGGGRWSAERCRACGTVMAYDPRR